MDVYLKEKCVSCPGAVAQIAFCPAYINNFDLRHES